MSTDGRGMGALVTLVYRGGPADKAGLRKGDLITQVGTKPIHTNQEFMASLSDLPVDKPSAVQVTRGEGLKTLEVRAERVVPLYGRLCDGNDFEACGTIGYMLAFGARVSPDPAKGEKYLIKSCDANNFPSCVNLGNVYENGLLGTPEPSRAAGPFERACSGHIIEGCINLGRLLQDGRGVPQDMVRAIELYQRACDANDGQTCRVVATLYLKGKGVPVDRNRARALSERACELGDKVACDWLRVWD
jgi:hypothetical protein